MFLGTSFKPHLCRLDRFLTCKRRMFISFSTMYLTYSNYVNQCFLQVSLSIRSPRGPETRVTWENTVALCLTELHMDEKSLGNSNFTARCRSPRSGHVFFNDCGFTTTVRRTHKESPLPGYTYRLPMACIVFKPDNDDCMVSLR